MKTPSGGILLRFQERSNKSTIFELREFIAKEKLRCLGLGDIKPVHTFS